MNLQTGSDVFAGIRVIELAQFVFVPGAGAILADFGAEVIKVEEPRTGDPYRTLQINDGRQTASANLAMEQNNRNKKSVAIDLKSESGRELFFELIESADIFITSIRPKAIEKLGLGIDELRKRNPKLIYARGNALGFKGEQVDRPGYDASCFWARGGFADALRPIGHEQPIDARPALGDHAGAANIALGLSMALYKRERTGEPSVVDVSLMSSALWIASADVVLAGQPHYDTQASKANVLRQPLVRSYRCSDDKWLQLMFLDPTRYWAELCQRLGHTELMDDPLFSTAGERSANGPALYAALSKIFAEHPRDHWQLAFSGWDAPWEPVQSISDVSRDPEARANDHFFDIQVSDGTKVELVTGPVTIDGSTMAVSPRRAPEMGEHTEEILTGLGVDAGRFAQLKQEGVIA